jgi:hypothetical protein
MNENKEKLIQISTSLFYINAEASHCVEEEERQKAKRMKDDVNFVAFNPPKNQAESGSSKQHNKRKHNKHKVNYSISHKKIYDEKWCKFCKSPKYLQKDFVGFK